MESQLRFRAIRKKIFSQISMKLDIFIRELLIHVERSRASLFHEQLVSFNRSYLHQVSDMDSQNKWDINTGLELSLDKIFRESY